MTQIKENGPYGICWGIDEYSDMFPGMEWRFFDDWPAIAAELSAPTTSLCLVPIRLRGIELYAEMEWIQSVQTLLTVEELGRFSPQALNLSKWEETLYAVPEDIRAFTLIVWNKSLKKRQMVIPKTWQELEEQLVAFKSERDNPVCLINVREKNEKLAFFLSLLGSNGINPTQDLNTYLNKPAPLLEAYDWMQHLVKEDLVRIFPFRKENYSISNQNLYIFGWPNLYSQLNISTSPTDVSISPFPRGPSCQNLYSPIAGMGWCIPKRSRFPEIGAKAIKTILSDQNVKKTESITNGSLYSSLTSIWQDPEILRKKPFYQFANEIFNSGTFFSPFKIHFTFASLSDSFFQGLEKGISGKEWIHRFQNLEPDKKISTPQHHVIKLALIYIEGHLSSIKDVEQIAGHFQLNIEYFNRLFKQNTKITCREYLSMKRMDLARDLLKKTSLSIKQITYQLGFQNIGTFRKVFKKRFGCSATEMRTNFLENPIGG